MALDGVNLSSLSRSVEWVCAALTGTVATVVAMLAVAALGISMLSGRLPTRRAAEVIVGCFVLFSGRVVAGALLNLGDPETAVPPPAVEPAAPYTPTTPEPVPYDPYAGASVPTSAHNQPITK